jgi:hypothetical protein
MIRNLWSGLQLVVISLTLVLFGGIQSGHAVVTLRGSVAAGASYSLIGGSSAATGMLSLPALSASIEAGALLFTFTGEVGYIPRAFVENSTTNLLNSLYVAVAPRFWLLGRAYLDAGGFYTINTALAGNSIPSNDYGLRVGAGVLFPLFPFVKLLIASNFNYTFASANGLSPHFFQFLGGVMFGL